MGKLNDYVEVLDFKRIPVSSQERATREKIYPYYGAQGIVDYIDDYIFDGEYILVAEDGENLRSLHQNIATWATGKFWVNNHAHILGEKETANLKYLYYYLNWIDLRRYVTGSAQPKLNQDNLSNIDINLPPRAIQDHIAQLLSKIDDKIALNNRVNATLEAMAKTLYDYWFVQFDFPDEKGRPYKTSGGKMVYNEELGREIPAGWEVKRLSDFVDISTEAENPLDNPQTLYEHYSIPAYDEGKYPFIERGDSINSSKYVVKSNSLLYAKLNPTFKRLWAPFCFSEHAICSTEFIVLELRERDNYGFVYSVLNDISFQQYMQKQASSSTGSRKRVQPDNGLKYSIVCPPEEILKRFGTLYELIIQRNKTLIVENHRIAALRDWLLPMLMNGQVGFKGDC